ncbi:PLP-dependent aminotransferase family protein [Parvibaculum sp.]|uniref:aminotransferase-like domain-containing protein n=1 Tax=Parvibaculum sp. TaxID=2024848 RepID=UPI00320CB539
MTFSLTDLLKEQRPGPRYRVMADLIAEAIADGRLAPGARLPALRDIAYELGVTVGTVARAYSQAASRGLVAGEVGRGTYVLARTPREPMDGVGSASFHAAIEGAEVPMKAALAAPVGQTEIMSATLRSLLDELPKREGPSIFNTYLAPGGTEDEREAAARWLAYGAFAPSPERMLLCSGTQQAILTSLLTACEPGDLVLTEALTYHAMIAQASLMGFRIAPVDLDAEGILPEALERAIIEQKPRAIFLVPTIHNPTTSIMGEARRIRIAEIARTHGVAVIEDDIYGTLVGDRPAPIAHYYPDGTYYATSLAKSLGCGLRVGYLIPPADKLDRARAILHGQGQTVPPLSAELATSLIVNGAADKLVAAQRTEMAARHAIALELLGTRDMRHHPAALFVWLRLPEAWRAHAFVEAARQRGVALAAGEDFMVGRPDRAARHVRIALGQAQSREALRHGLSVIAALIDSAPAEISALA